MINGHRLGGLIGEREQHIMEREKEQESERKKEGTKGNSHDESAVCGAAELNECSRGHNPEV